MLYAPPSEKVSRYHTARFNMSAHGSKQGQGALPWMKSVAVATPGHTRYDRVESSRRLQTYVQI